MNPAWLHLTLNHLPVVGSYVGLLLLIWGMAARKPDLTRAALLLFVIVALAGAATYVTGEPAEDVAERAVGLVRPAIHPHEEAGEVALIAAGVLGVLSLATLALWRRNGSRALLVLVLLAALATSGTMSYTAFLGGKIRHPEAHGTTAAASGNPQAGSEEHEEEEEHH